MVILVEVLLMDKAKGMIAINPNIIRPTKEATLFTKPAIFAFGIPSELLMLTNSLIEL